MKTTELNSNDLFQITGTDENHLSWNGSFFKTSKRFVAIIDDVPKESNDAYTKPEAWTPCEQLPF